MEIVGTTPWLFADPATQQHRFTELAPRFAAHCQQMRSFPYDDFIVPFWTDVETRLEAILLPEPPATFLENNVIRGMMFVCGDGPEFEDKLAIAHADMTIVREPRILSEDPVGAPELLGDPPTSHNTLHHVHHLVRYGQHTQLDWSAVNVVAEWGGGYGNLCKLLHRLRSCATAEDLTYIIIDLPLMTTLQWLYLSSVFGEERVHLLDAPGTAPKVGCINLLPVGLLDHYTIEADTFVSTWALSESTAHAQRYVVDRQWFGAKRVLLGYQKNDVHRDDFVEPQALEAGLQAKGGQVLPFPFAPDNYYGFV